MVALRRRGAAPPGDEVLRGHGGEQQRDLQHRRGPEHRHDRTAGTCPETKSTCTKVSAKIHLGDSSIFILVNIYMTFKFVERRQLSAQTYVYGAVRFI